MDAAGRFYDVRTTMVEAGRFGPLDSGGWYGLYHGDEPGLRAHRCYLCDHQYFAARRGQEVVVIGTK